MKIVVDVKKAENLQSGLGQFCFHLGNELLKLNKEALIFYGIEKHSLFPGAELFNPDLIKKITGNIPANAKVWHCTHQEPDFYPADKCKLVLTIHDLNFLYKYKSEWRINTKIRKLQKLINKASAVTTVSHFTMKEINNHFFIPDIPQEVIYNGVAIADVEPSKPSFAPNVPFLFTIGIISPKKNFHVLIPFIEKLNYKLIIAGDTKSSYVEEIKNLATEYKVEDKLIIPGKVTEAEKVWLYQHCEAFVFPSLSEGFGLPVVEAMSFGKPVFVSDKTSLPEIGSEAAFYWNDFEPEYMRKIFQEAMNEYKNNKELKNKIIDRSRQFTWKSAAEKYMQLYHYLAK